MADSESFTKTQIVTGVIVGIILIAVVILFFFLQQGSSSLMFQDDTCRVNESGMLIDPCVPLFKIINGTYDTIEKGEHSFNKSGSAPAPEDCPRFVEKALEPYRGLPADANLSSITDAETMGFYNRTTNAKTEWVVRRCVDYDQIICGKPIVGHGGYLTVCLSDGGIPDYISKNWRSVEEIGMERVIPASEAIMRLKNHEGRFNPPTKTLIYDNIPDGAFNLTINEMELRYFASSDITNETFLEPVWRFKTVDNIRRMPFIFYIPASYRTTKYAHLKSDLLGTQRNFSQIGGILPNPDVSFPQFVLMGTSGPVGRENAEKSVRLFIENPEINLTYDGRYRSSSGGCGGGYQGEYYIFRTRDCLFTVDVFSGSVIRATINESCIKPGFSGKSVSGNITVKNAQSLAEHFASQKYTPFDSMHVSSYSYPYPAKLNDGKSYLVSLAGDFGVITESGLYIYVRIDDGLITRYQTRDDDLQYACGGEESIRIDE